MEYKAIIFDMDGLLVDSEPVWHEVEIDLIESLRLHLFRLKYAKLGIGMRVDEFAAISTAAYYPRLGDSPAAIEAAITGRLLALPAGAA